MGVYTQPLVQRLWAKIDYTTDPTGCWPWTGSTDGEGYGVILFERKLSKAHRGVWRVLHGDPGKLKVLHTCDNPPCCRPSHLFTGTQADNVRDMIAKGRQRSGGVRGEKHGRAIITEVDVITILTAHRGGESQVSIAARYPTIGYSMVNNIVRRKNWTHVSIPIDS